MKKLVSILASIIALAILVSCSSNVVVKPDRPDFTQKVGQVWVENDKIFSVGVGQSQNTSIATTKAKMDGAAYISEYFSKEVTQAGNTRITKSSAILTGSHVIKRYAERRENGIVVMYILMQADY